MNLSDGVVVATLGRPFGVRGWIHVNSHTDPPENLLAFDRWYVEQVPGGDLVAVEPEVRRHGEGRLVATFEPLRGRDDAQRMTGALVYVAADSLPDLEADEYYWNDLIGLVVVNGEGVTLGRVERLVPTGPNDVLVIRGEGEHFVPFVGAYVDKVLPGVRIEVDWRQEWSE